MPVNERWKNFLNYLENHGDEYNQVLIADTRDLIFQDDVFKYFSDESNFLGYTTECDDIRGSKSECKVNYIWMTNCFGKEEADKLADKEIICIGTVMGTVEEMKIFLQKLIEFLPDVAQFHGLDQVTMQHIMYNNLLPIKNLIKIDCHSGAILTEYLFHLLHSVNIKDNFILRGDGGVPAVAHQYDRFPQLVQLVNEVYREKDFEFNPNFTDVKSSFEQMLHLINAEKFSDALQLTASLVDNPDFNAEKFKFCKIGGYFEYLIDFWNVLFAKFPQQTTTIEMLELAIQHILLKVFTAIEKEFLIIHFDKVVGITLEALKNNRVVSKNFKLFLVNQLFALVNQSFQQKNFNQCLRWLKAMEEFNIPLNKNFYQLQAQVFNQLGRKKEAKQIMKKIFSN